MPKPTAKQLGMLHVAKRVLALTDADYRGILANIAGVESASDLDSTGFQAVLNHFEKLGFKLSRKADSFGDRRGMASPSQVALIRKLWREYYSGPAEDEERALNKWLTRYHTVSALRFVSVEAARKIIPGLRTMALRGRASPPPAASQSGHNGGQTERSR